MEYIGFVQYGELKEYREKLESMGRKAVFQKGTDVARQLWQKHCGFYLDSGLLYLRLYKADGDYLQVIAFNEGTVFPLYDMRESFQYVDVKMLVAARGEVSGFLIPIQDFYKLKEADHRFAALLERQLSKTAASLSVSQILYRDGECITRICNLLFHTYHHKDYEAEVLPMWQEELASTVNVSKSQVKRALSQLKEEGGIELLYGRIRIRDIRIVEQYISESLRMEEMYQ